MRAGFLIVLALALSVGPPAAADEAEIALVVVVARDSKLTSVSRTDLQRAYSGEPVTAGGGRLVPFNLSPSAPDRVRFDRAILGMSPSAAGRYWVDRKIRGGSAPPRSLPSPVYVVKVVAKFPGAIGYVPANQVTRAVKVVAIDGVLPGRAGYPLGGN